MFKGLMGRVAQPRASLQLAGVEEFVELLRQKRQPDKQRQIGLRRVYPPAASRMGHGV
jgi:hypothetical protein